MHQVDNLQTDVISIITQNFAHEILFLSDYAI